MVSQEKHVTRRWKRSPTEYIDWGLDMRAKFGINDTENTGEIGNVWWTVGRVSARHGKVSDKSGMKCSKSVELPKLDVAGSIALNER